ncbi:MAG: hypothetical protein HFG33_03015 [Bacilli bacterium]|nr:hypothetical protein [Bacilli bacterium]
MLEFLELYLPIVIYVLLIILLIIGIILGMRIISAMDKIDAVLDNVQRKVNSLNGLFSVIDFTTDKISAFSDKVVDVISGFISKIGRRKNSKYVEEEDEFYE